MRRIRRYAVALATLLAAGLAAAQAPDLAAHSDTTVMTQSGQVRGHQHDGVMRYLGIPYAAPPVDKLRWRAPQDPASWQGVRDADRFGSACAQTGNFYASDDPRDFGKPYGSEDCLYLNVWVPPSDGQRPVLFFVHGGAGIYGAASLSAYEASRLARELNAVVVSINYRLGFFGGIDSLALHTGNPLDDAGNFGFLDQLKALDWVQKNIAAFGGDVHNVTVMGHSAGGVSVWSMLRSPLAHGKFSKAFVMSGIPLSNDADAVKTRTDRLLARLMTADGLIADKTQLPKHLQTLGEQGLRDYLYSKSTAQLVEAARGLRATVGSDDTVLPPYTGEPAHDFINAVPMLLGTVDNEASLLLMKRYAKPDIQQFWALMNSGRRDLDWSNFFSFFDYCKFRVADGLFNYMLHGKVEKAANQLATTGTPVYRYVFEWNRQPQPWRDLFGAYHGLDIPFVFGNFLADTPSYGRFSWTPGNAGQREAIHGRMVDALKGFVESADPNKYPTKTQWPRWNDTGEVAVIR